LVAVVCFLILCFEIGQKASVSFIFLQIIAVNLFWFLQIATMSSPRVKSAALENPWIL
jgi:hypothetical protein